MEPRPRIRTLLRRAGISAALVALLLPALAGTATAAHRHASKHHASHSAKHHSKKHHKKKHHHKRKKSKLPVVSSVRPLNAGIGDTLVLRGRNFRRGVDKNTVAFKRRGARVVFVKARLATRKMLKVVLPDRLASVLKTRNGGIVPTRLSIRVLAKRFGKRFTRRGLSPIVSPRRPPALTPPVTAADGDCDGDRLKNRVDRDDDNDLLSDADEARLGTDACKADSDGDGATDGYEYQSAVDLNDDEYRAPQDITPAPVRRPYPNPLFPDAGTDYDGDGLALGTEFSLWAAYRNPSTGLDNLIYSDGNQYSAYGRDANGNRPGPLVGADPEDKYRSFEGWASGAGFWKVNVRGLNYFLDDLDRDGNVSSTPGSDGSGKWYEVAEARWYDFDNNGVLSDDERDEDADGLSNYDENMGRMQPGYWVSCYQAEKPYTVSYAGTDVTNPDSDGDGIRDGADDQDHDDVPNLQELSRNMASGRVPQGDCHVDQGQTANPTPSKGFVNPFNPCLPYTDSRTCTRHPSFGNLPAPFDPSTQIYFVLN